jgi:hypothetical protein
MFVDDAIKNQFSAISYLLVGLGTVQIISPVVTRFDKMSVRRELPHLLAAARAGDGHVD